MNATSTIALNNLVATAAAKAARDELSVGTHSVDMMVHVTGTLTVGADTEKTPTVSIPVKEVLALFIARSGCTREASLALLKSCLSDALADSTKAVGAIDNAVDIDAEFKAAVAGLTASLPKTPVKGAVKAKLTVTEVAERPLGINQVAAK